MKNDVKNIEVIDPQVIETCRKKVLYNRKRSNKVSALKRKNFKLTQQIDELYTNNGIVDAFTEKYLMKLRKNLNLCACHSLYREHVNNNAVEYIGSHTCDHKLCFVCNNLRQKRLRRKYLNFFKNNLNLVLLKTVSSGSVRAVTENKYYNLLNDNKIGDTHEYIDDIKYDLMHLTLTVPHYEGSGFRGYPYYYEYISRLFNFLRKKKKWNELVYGGEYGIETTKKNNGLNIHIHSLLLVKRGSQNRNILHKYILKQWNKMTINAYNPREELNEYAIEKIMKSNKLLSFDETSKLHPKGSTIITLENIYNYDDNGKKERVNDFGSDKMMKAVMETISYHFEPQCFDKENGTYDLDLMVEIMPHLEGKPLYRKFGCLHGEKSLNVKVNVADRIAEDLEETGEAHVMNPITFEIAEREEITFFVANPCHVLHIPEQNYIPVFSRFADKAYMHDASDTKNALIKMTFMFLDTVRNDLAKQHAKAQLEDIEHNISHEIKTPFVPYFLKKHEMIESFEDIPKDYTGYQMGMKFPFTMPRKQDDV